MTTQDTIILGAVEVTRVFEQHRLGLPRGFAFPDVDEDVWRRHEDWLAPEFWDTATDEMVASLKTWVVRSEGATILVDTGVGNDRDRPGMPVFDHLDTGYLDNLSAAGVAPEDVDLVVITHLHADHVGWNTRLDAGEWVPTFPNARYLMARADIDYWNPANGHTTRSGPRMAGVFEDSVAPVIAAGLVDQWEGSHRIDANLSLEPAPGHTPGSAVLKLDSGTDRAAFVGDLLHTPLQIVEPDICPCLDEDEAKARVSRRRVLDSVADENRLLLPAHFPSAGAVELRRDGDRYAITEWAAFA
ncbi:MAG TPA: MBL fold metallo-hydrolase [Pseudonocardia sp.]|jgi:glyoxylase-like metal-dependent hydrolase (beta-lactamase superfamily II)|nr:MBL fold metallo-hydrolase [Pseudonocardia sp.]